MKEVVEIQKLLRQQQSYIKAIVTLQEELLKTQALIMEEIYNNSRRDDIEEKTVTDLLSSKDVCKILGISSSTLYRLRTQNELPFVKIEGRKSIMFSKKEIEEYISNLKLER